MSAEFRSRSQQAIKKFARRNYGSTAFENEKRSYPRAMMDFQVIEKKRSPFCNLKTLMLIEMLTPWELTFILALLSKVKSANTSTLVNILTQAIASA